MLNMHSLGSKKTFCSFYSEKNWSARFRRKSSEWRKNPFHFSRQKVFTRFIKNRKSEKKKFHFSWFASKKKIFHRHQIFFADKLGVFVPSSDLLKEKIDLKIIGRFNVTMAFACLRVCVVGGGWRVSTEEALALPTQQYLVRFSVSDRKFFIKTSSSNPNQFSFFLSRVLETFDWRFLIPSW